MKLKSARTFGLVAGASLLALSGAARAAEADYVVIETPAVDVGTPTDVVVDEPELVVDPVVIDDVGIIVSDTFGRPWRRGLTDVAIGVAGIAAVVDLRGTADALGRVMQVTEVAVADELASAAELVMGKSSGIPVAVVRGADATWFRDASINEIVRPASEDLFR